MIEVSIILIAIATGPEANATALPDIASRIDPTLTLDDARLAAFADESREPFGKAGTKRWMIQGGFGSTFKNSEHGQLGVGISWFAADDFSIDLELNAMHFDVAGPDATGINTNLLLRWHMIHNEQRTWSAYVDGGAGLLVTDEHVPSHGESFNFTPQIGGGMSFDIGNGNRIMAGVRWHHVSNANTSAANPGRDAMHIYTALSIPF